MAKTIKVGNWEISENDEGDLMLNHPDNKIVKSPIIILHPKKWSKATCEKWSKDPYFPDM